MTAAQANQIHVVVTFTRDFDADGCRAFAKVITGFDASRPGGFALAGRFVAGKRLYEGGGTKTQFQAHVPETGAALCICIQERDSKKRACILFRPDRSALMGAGTLTNQGLPVRWENAAELRMIEDSGDASPFNALYAAGEWLLAAGLIPAEVINSPLPPMTAEAIRAQEEGMHQPYTVSMTAPPLDSAATLIGPVTPKTIIPARKGNLVEADNDKLPVLPHPYYWANEVSGVLFVGCIDRGGADAPMLFLDCLIDVIDRIEPGQLPALEKVLRDQQARLGGLGMALDVVANVLALKSAAAQRR